MKTIKNIRYQALENKYINSAVECLNEVRNQPGSSNRALGASEITTSEEDNIFCLFPDICTTTIVAIDTSKDNYVCGILPGFNLFDYIEYMKLQTSDSVLSEKNYVSLRLLEPFISHNYQKGEFLIGAGYGVRSGYENQQIGQNLSQLFIQNAEELGYLITSGIVQNPVSKHILEKQGYQMLNYIDLANLNLPLISKSNIKNQYVFFYGFIITKNIIKSKFPQVVSPRPSL